MVCPWSGRPLAYLGYWLPLSIFRTSNGWVSLFHITSLWHYVSATFSAFKGPVFTLCVCICACVCVSVCVQSCPALFDHMMDCSPPSSSVHGISQARIPKQVAISSSKRSSWLRVGYNPCLLCLLHWLVDSLPFVPPRKPLGLHQVSSGKSRLISLFWAQLTNDLCSPWFSIVTSHTLGEIRTWASLEAIIFLSRVFLGLAARAIQWKLGRGRNYDHGWWSVDRERKKFLGPTLQNGKFSLSKHLVLKIWHLAFPLKKIKYNIYLFIWPCHTSVVANPGPLHSHGI